MRILAGDIGGTHTHLALFEGKAPQAMKRVREKKFSSQSHKSLDEVVRLFLAADTVDVASFGVAGPVVDNAVRATNLPWHVVPGELRASLGIARVFVLNDFHAVAMGIPLLAAADLQLLHDGEVDPDGPVVVAGAGTGLGEAILVHTSTGPVVLASEGGHTDFAPRNADEIALLQFMLTRHARVSVERVVSGMGLAAIFDFVTSTGRAVAAPSTLARMNNEDKGAVIGELALKNADAACSFTVQLFLSMYGAELGNLALKVLPRGGLYVAGGIAPRLLPLLSSSQFMESFLAKGRMRPLLEVTRVSLILQTDVGLLGALNYGMTSKND